MLQFWQSCATYQAIAHALHVCRGNRTRAAAILGIQRTYLHRLLRQVAGR